MSVSSPAACICICSLPAIKASIESSAVCLRASSFGPGLPGFSPVGAARKISAETLPVCRCLVLTHFLPLVLLSKYPAPHPGVIAYLAHHLSLLPVWWERRIPEA